MVSERKKDFVRDLSSSIQKAPLVGVLNLQNLPAAQLQVMRAKLRKKNITMVMARKKLLQRALQQSQKENVALLQEKIKGMPALLFADDNPFALYALLQKSKSSAPAKVGQIAPHDIVVKEGPTSFAPGPIISELAAVGIKTKVDQGKLKIISDTVIVKEGQPISSKVAETLKRLDIKPMEIGLELVAVWEKGVLFDGKQLHIDEEEYSSTITNAVQWAMNLAVESVFLTTETSELILQKAFREAKAVALEGHILTEVTLGDLMALAEREAHTLTQESAFEKQ